MEPERQDSDKNNTAANQKRPSQAVAPAAQNNSVPPQTAAPAIQSKSRPASVSELSRPQSVRFSQRTPSPPVALPPTENKPAVVAEPPMPAHEQVIHDKLKKFLLGRGYELQHKIGGGGMGQVFKVYHTALKRVEALKILYLNDRQVTENDITRFEREAQALARLANEHRELPIPQVFDYFQSEGYFGYIMQFVEGEPLDQLIRQRSLTVDRAVRIACDLAKSLQILHKQNIVHRDIKPSNIIIREEIPWLIDFGLAKDLDHEVANITEPGRALGTVMYMAPEQVEGMATAQSDIYALGAVLYEMLSFQPTVSGHSYSEVFYRILHVMPEPPSRCRARVMTDTFDTALDHICLKALAKEANKRYHHAGDMARELANYLRGIKNPFHPYRLRQALPALKAAAPLVLVLLLVTGGYFVVHKPKQQLTTPAQTVARPVDKPVTQPAQQDPKVNVSTQKPATPKMEAACKAYQKLVENLAGSDISQVLAMCSEALVKEDLGIQGMPGERKMLFMRIVSKAMSDVMGEVESVLETNNANEVKIHTARKKQPHVSYMVYEGGHWKYDGDDVQRSLRNKNLKPLRDSAPRNKEVEAMLVDLFRMLYEHNREAFEAMCAAELDSFKKEIIFMRAIPVLRRQKLLRPALFTTVNPTFLVAIYKLPGQGEELKVVLVQESGKWKLRDMLRKQP